MRPVIKWINARSIKTKMLAGFASVLIILLGVAGSGYLRFLGVETSFKDYAQRVDVVAISYDIDRDFTELRRFVREYALQGDPADATSAIAVVDRVKRDIDQALATTLNPERRRNVQDIATQFGEYRAGIDIVFAQRREEDKLVIDVVDPTGVGARSDFDALIDSTRRSGNLELTSLAQEGQQALMRLRLNSSKVIGRRVDEIAAKKVEETQADLTRLMGALNAASGSMADRSLFEKLRTRVAAYEAAYRQALQLNAKLHKQLGAMKLEAEQLASAAAAVRASGIADQATIKTEALAAVSATTTLLLLLAGGGLVLGLAVAWLIGGGISRPIVRITGVMHRLASGDLEVEIPALDRGDEVGQMAQALQVFRENAREARRLAGEAERVRAAKDRRQAAMDQCTQDFGTSASGVMTMLASSAETMRKTADEMTQAAHQTRDTAGQTAENAAISAQNLGSVAAAAEEMSASIHEISQQVARATHAAQEAVERASETDAKVGGMAAAAERVGDVVRLISDIAGQTNLLPRYLGLSINNNILRDTIPFSTP